MEELKLVYVNPVGLNSDGEYEFDFFFSNTPETVWGEDWNVSSPSACANLLPDETSYSLIKRYKTPYNLNCVQNNSCFSMQDCIDGIIALMWFTDDEDNTHAFKFATDYDTVISQFGEGVDIKKTAENEDF